MQTTVGVQFDGSKKVYSFDANGKTYKAGDRVLVETTEGKSLGKVINVTENAQKGEFGLKPVLRLASAGDLAREKELEQKAKRALPIVEQKIKEAKLVMKVVDVRYNFDDTKITITFTAEGRVDFRELLKLLASSLKTKIELRQIGVKDEVERIGGLGLCGRPCCCTEFLKEPAHITVKMVKTQNLSMSPTKTGGLCGRMMCCLAFEDPVYREMLAEMPALGSIIDTPDGKGKVQFNDILKRRVMIKFDGENGASYKEYLLEELRPELKKIEETNCVPTESEEKATQPEVQKPEATHAEPKAENNVAPSREQKEDKQTAGAEMGDKQNKFRSKRHRKNGHKGGGENKNGVGGANGKMGAKVSSPQNGTKPANVSGAKPENKSGNSVKPTSEQKGEAENGAKPTKKRWFNFKRKKK